MDKIQFEKAITLNQKLEAFKKHNEDITNKYHKIMKKG